jgi:aldehyde dehydrogenase (NAD+)
VLETLDSGKPIRETRAVDVPLAAAHVFSYAGWADKLPYAGFGPNSRPLGVSAQLITWHCPLLILVRAVAPALACGNTVVVKPAESTPLSALAFAEICREAGLPPGVVNIVTGGAHTGRLLAEHPGVDQVTFTGSTEAGRLIARSAARTATRLALDLAAQGVNIVFDDAPLAQAVESVVHGLVNTRSLGRAGSRLLVQENVYDEFLDALTRRLGRVRVGDPLDRNTDLGPIHSAARLAHIRELAQAGDAAGDRRWTPDGALPDRGFWFPPTVFTDVSQSQRIARSEVGGPMLGVLTFRTPAEAVEKANDTPFSLSAGVWTEKGARVRWLAERLRAHTVLANTGDRMDPTSPPAEVRLFGAGQGTGRPDLAAHLETIQGAQR